MQAPSNPSTKALFLALHPPRRFWPGLAGFYATPNQAKNRPRG